MNIFKKSKLEFVARIPGVEQVMPIIPAKELEHPWVVRAKNDAANHLKQNQAFQYSPKTGRCPGIYEIMREGWVARLWQDISIETFNDGVSFNWASPVKQTFSNIETVGWHRVEDLYAYRSNWPQNTLKTIIKIIMPWSIRIPKGYYLLQMPVAFLDENRFTTVSGLINPNLGSHPMNIQMYWHVLEGKTLLKAGTPVAQFMLMKKEKVPWYMKSDLASAESVRDLIMSNKFVLNYSKVRKFFET